VFLVQPLIVMFVESENNNPIFFIKTFLVNCNQPL